MTIASTGLLDVRFVREGSGPDCHRRGASLSGYMVFAGSGQAGFAMWIRNCAVTGVAPGRSVRYVPP